MRFSWLHFFFVLTGTFSYFLLVNFFRSRAWQIFCYVSISVFYLWSLVNFAFFKVFNVFLDFSAGQIAGINLSLLSMLKDFYYLIPIEFYIGMIILLSCVIVSSVYYNKMAERDIEKIFFNERILNVISVITRSKKQVSAIIIVFVIVNIISLGLCSYLYKNPRASWWNAENQLSDIGIWGHFYSSLADKLGFLKNQPLDEAKAAEDPEELIEEEPEPITLVGQTKKIYGKMNFEKSNPLPLPQFDSFPNILVVQLESVGSWAINNNPSPMPFLKSLINENISVDEFHSNGCETINAEFSSLCGFWPDSFEPVSYSHQEKQFYCLPEILSEKFSYNTYFFHANLPEFWSRDILMPKWGFENTYFTPFFRQKEDDANVFSKSIDILSEEENPFFGYITAFTTHSPHNDELIKYQKEKNNLQINLFSGAINPEYESSELNETEMRQYFGFLSAADDALKSLFEELEEKDLRKNTVAVIYNDHRFYNFKEKTLENFNFYNENPFVIVLPEKQKGKIQSIASHIDIAPTILNLIEQESYQPEPNFAGTSLFSADFPSKALNKCLSNIYFTNNDIVIEGNAKTEQYQATYLKKQMTENEKNNLLSLVKNLVNKSDETIYSDKLTEIEPVDEN